MEKYVATAACLWLIVHLFRSDLREHPGESGAMWIPLLWMFFAGSRYLSSWLSLGGPGSETMYDEGSPIDRAVFFALLVAGMIVLARRQIDWAGLLGRNKLLTSYLLYCLISVLWSDEPFIGFKRWVKDLGNPVMALIILTSPRPLEALGIVVRRLAILWLPLSVLFVRYFPELGRVHHIDGTPLYTGVGHQKNALGQMCLVTGIYFAWLLLQQRERLAEWSRPRRWRLWSLVAMDAYLLYMSNSQTSLGAMVLAVSALACARLELIRREPQRLVTLALGAALVIASLESAYDLKNNVLLLLGRDPSLTNRTELWSILFDVGSNPMVGSGFMSFWAGARLDIIWARLGAAVLQAHSGYIEQYLNLGYVGVAFIVLLLANALIASRAIAASAPAYAHLRVAIVFAAAAYNYTEAAFYGVNNMWILLLIGLFNLPTAPSRHMTPARRRANVTATRRSHAPSSRQPRPVRH